MWHYWSCVWNGRGHDWLLWTLSSLLIYTTTCQLKPTSTPPTSPSKFHLAYGIDKLTLSIARFGTSFSYRITHQTHNILLWVGNGDFFNPRVRSLFGIIIISVYRRLGARHSHVLFAFCHDRTIDIQLNLCGTIGHVSETDVDMTGCYGRFHCC